VPTATPEPTATAAPTDTPLATNTPEDQSNGTLVEPGPELDEATYLRELNKNMRAFDRENSNYGALMMDLPEGKIRNASAGWLMQAKLSNSVRLAILAELKRLNAPERHKPLQADVLKFALSYEKVLMLFNRGIDNLDDVQFMLGAMQAADALGPYLDVMAALHKLGY
jgi:hypothetical protein